MIDEVLFRIFTREWRVILIISLLLLALAQAGFSVAKRRYRETTERHKTQITGIQTTVLGLLALLLGFTFAMALGRYDSRGNLVLQEANGIGTYSEVKNETKDGKPTCTTTFQSHFLTGGQRIACA
jgi:hypothetical protein